MTIAACEDSEEHSNPVSRVAGYPAGLMRG